MFVMPGLVPGIHVFTATKTWMAGLNPAMTTLNAVQASGARFHASKVP
jgi:hypothetical protein